MKSRAMNRYRRRQDTHNVRRLESALSLTNRLFSRTAFKRGVQRMRRWLLMLLCAAPFLWLIYWGVNYALEKAYSMSIDNISYESRQHLISREQALRILELEGSVNMSNLDAGGMERKLKENPCIADAHIRAELPDTLSIEVEERIPVVYVEMEHAAGTGSRERLFMDPSGCLFPVEESYHANFMGVPVWYLRPGDVDEFKVGSVIDEKFRRPIVELVAAANMYSLLEIPSIREIFRPKDWKILITLEGGTEVMMQVYDIKGQMERLAMILEHARTTKHHAQEVNVIPRINPTVRYSPDTTPAPAPVAPSSGKNRRTR